jgi:hypothetical protein
VITFNAHMPKIAYNAGFLYDWLVEISKALNFTIKYPADYNISNKLHRFLPIVLHLEPSTFGSPSYYPAARRHLTEYLYTNSDFYAVPPGEIYSGFEKVLFPFDHPTWFLILFTFVAAFVTIFIVNHMTSKIRNLVFGEDVSTPSMNVAAHFFGIGQVKVPQRSFARILIMIFILYCLIIRTTWQSKFFEFMQKDMRHLEVKTVAEVKEKYQNIYYTHGRIIDGNPVIDYSAFEKIVHITNNPSFDGVLFVNTRYFPEFLAAFKGPEIFKRILFHEPLLEAQMGISFPLNNKFYERFNEVIRRLNEAGIIKTLVAKYYTDFDPKRFEKPIQIVDSDGRKRIHKKYLETTWHNTNMADKEPKVLTLSDLEFGFVIWLGSLVFPLIAFEIEIIFCLITKIQNQIKIAPEIQTPIEKISISNLERKKICSQNTTKLGTLGMFETLEEINDESNEDEEDETNEFVYMNLLSSVDPLQNHESRHIKQACT